MFLNFASFNQWTSEITQNYKGNNINSYMRAHSSGVCVCVRVFGVCMCELYIEIRKHFNTESNRAKAKLNI